VVGRNHFVQQVIQPLASHNRGERAHQPVQVHHPTICTIHLAIYDHRFEGLSAISSSDRTFHFRCLRGNNLRDGVS
jgi:hypothetical protein